MNIEEILRDYKRKKSIVETTLARIEQYKIAANNPDAWEKLYVPQYIEIGMPRAKSIKSPVEASLMTKELTIGTIKEWIAEDESRIFLLKLEVDQIDKSLIRLTKHEKYIIECKYFEGLFWKDIEINFNEVYRQKNYITVSGIRKINKEALLKLEEVLEPFFHKFKIA